MLYVYPTLVHWFNDHPILFDLWFSGRQTYRNFGQWPSHAATIQHGSALEGGKLHLHHWYWAFLVSHYPIFDCLLSSLAQVGGREGTNWGNQPWGGTNWGTRKSGDHSIIMLFDMFVSMEIFEITSFGLRLQSSVGLWFSLEQVGSDSRRLIPSSSSATVKTSHGSKETPDNPTSLRCKNFETICNHCFLLL
jgi:hypothetical protein